MAQEEVGVRFGGSTSGLDNAANKAVQDVEKVGKAAGGLKGTFGQVADGMKKMFTGIDTGTMEKGKEKIAETAKEAFSLKSAALELMPVLAGLAAAFTFKGMFELGKEMADLAEHLDKVGQKLGMSATEISKWDVSARAMGMSAESVEGGLTRLERSMVLASNGGKQQAAIFKSLGIDIASVKSPTEAVLRIADKFKGMEDGPKKIALAMGTMGRAGAEMIPILNQGSEGIKRMFEESDEMGATMSESLVEAGLAVDEEMDRMNMGLTGVRNTMFDELAPAIVAIVSGFNDLIKEFIESYRQGGVVKDIIVVIGGAFKMLISVIGEVIAIFKMLWHTAVATMAAIIGPLKTVVSTVSAAVKGDWAGAASSWTNGWKGTGRVVAGEFGEAKKAGSDWYNWQKKLWDRNPTMKGPKPKGGASMDMDIPGLVGTGTPKKDHSKEEAKKRLEAYLEELQFKQDLARDDFAEQMRLEEEKLAAIKGFYGQDSREYQRELRNKIKMQRDHDQEIVQLQQDALQHKMALAELTASADHEIASGQIEEERARLQDMVDMGKMSDVEKQRNLAKVLMQEFQMEMEHENRMFQLHVQELRDEMNLQNMRPQERAKILAKIEEVEAQHNERIRAMNAKNSQQMSRQTAATAQAVLQKWQGAIQPLTAGLSNMFQGLYNRQIGFKQGMLQLADSLVMNWAQKGFEMLGNWVAMELAKTTATEAQTAIRTATETTSAATGAAASAAAGMTQVTTNAAVGASGAFAATAPIPFVGPALAPGVAAGALAAILGFGAMIASASGGYDIPSGTNPMTQLHEEEMVLPAHIANPLRASLRGGGPQMSSTAAMSAAAGAQTRSDTSLRGGDSQFHYKPQINHGNIGFETLLKKDGNRMRRWFRNEMRNSASWLNK